MLQKNEKLRTKAFYAKIYPATSAATGTVARIDIKPIYLVVFCEVFWEGAGYSL